MKFKKPIELDALDDYGEDQTLFVFQRGAGTYKFKTIKAVTVSFWEIDDTGFFKVGVSCCSNLDEFDVNEGIKKAMGKARSKQAEQVEYEPVWLDMAEKIAIKTARRIDRRNRKRGKRYSSLSGVGEFSFGFRGVDGKLVSGQWTDLVYLGHDKYRVEGIAE